MPGLYCTCRGTLVTEAYALKRCSGCQHVMPGSEPGQIGYLKRKAAAPLKPTKPQEACDHGLFGDESRQVDLIDLLRQSSQG